MGWLETVVSMTIKGGIFMIPLFVVAIVSMILLIERMLYLRDNRIDSDQFHFDLKTALKDNALDQAIALSARTKGVIGRVIQEGLLRVKAGETDIEAATEKAILAEMISMEKSRGWIINMSQIAPLLGILGTVWGLIVAFMAIERTASTDPRLLASGIYQALVTTAAGLFVAIPVQTVWFWFRSRIDRFVLAAEDLYEEASRRLGRAA